jgi:haloacetate dehalogenase
MGSGTVGLAPFTPEALDEYLRCFTPEMIHSSCEDYRASASIDLDLDREDIRMDRKITCPLLVLWGKNGVIERCFHPLEDWREVAVDVRGHALPGGHYLTEELPAQVISELDEFFGA